MFCWTTKLKEVLNKRTLLGSVPEAAVLIRNSHSLELIQGCRSVLLLFIVRMLMVLEKLVVFVEGIFKNVILSKKFCKKFVESKKKI